MHSYSPRHQLAPVSLGSDLALNGTLALETVQHGKQVGSVECVEPVSHHYPDLDTMLRWCRDYGVEFPAVAPRIDVYK